MTNKPFDTVLQIICDLIAKEGSDDIYTFHISKTKLFKNIPKQEIIDSFRRLEMLGVIEEPAKPEHDAWREEKGSFIPDNANSICFYAGHEWDFGSWHQNYKRQNKIKLGELSQETIQDAQRALDEIDERIRLDGIDNLIKINRLRKDARQSILSLLFNKHAIYAFKGSFVLMKQDYLGNLKKLKEEIKGFLDDSLANKPEIVSSGNNKRITPIPLPSGVEWEALTIKFIDGHNVRIKYKEKTFSRDYKDMGFEDSKSHKPNKQWEFLEQLAKNHGDWFWGKQPTSRINMKKIDQAFGQDYDEDDSSVQNKGYSTRQAPDKIKKTKQLLSQTLKAVFQINSDPFFPYQRLKSYKIKIKLIS